MMLHRQTVKGDIMQLRRSVFLVFLGIFVPVAFGWGASVLSGTVVSLNPEQGRLVVLQDGTMRVVNVLATGTLPPSVRTGVHVTIWGSVTKTRPSAFRAQRIVVDKSGGKKNDPTGVRSRLIRGRIKPPGQ